MPPLSPRFCFCDVSEECNYQIMTRHTGDVETQISAKYSLRTTLGIFPAHLWGGAKNAKWRQWLESSTFPVWARRLLTCTSFFWTSGPSHPPLLKVAGHQGRVLPRVICFDTASVPFSLKERKLPSIPLCFTIKACALDVRESVCRVVRSRKPEQISDSYDWWIH